jgi:hypothetical protein
MASIKYHARQCAVKYITTALAIDTSTTLDSEMSGGTSFTGVLKDVSISPPEGDVEQVNLLGETSGFQNALYEEKAFTSATLTGTMVIGSAETLELLFGGAGTQIATNSYTRYQYGDSTSSKTRVKVGAILCTLDNSTDKLNVLFNNVMITKLGDLKPTGTDGHWERSFEARCLPADYYEEFKN